MEFIESRTRESGEMSWTRVLMMLKPNSCMRVESVFSTLRAMSSFDSKAWSSSRPDSAERTVSKT